MEVRGGSINRAGTKLVQCVRGWHEVYYYYAVHVTAYGLCCAWILF